MNLTPPRRDAARGRIPPATVCRLLAAGTLQARTFGHRTVVIDDARRLPDATAASRRCAA